MRSIVVLSAFISFSLAGSAMAQIYGMAHASSDGNRHVVSFTGRSFSETITVDYIFFDRWSIGLCGPRERLDDQRIAVPQDGPTEFSGTLEFEAPNPAVLYGYQPLAMGTDGEVRAVFSGIASDFTSYDLVSCVEVPFLRGAVVWDHAPGGLTFQIAPCSEHCWTQTLYVGMDGLTADLLEELSGEDPYSLLGEVVDVYGTIVRGQLLGAPSHDVTRIVRAETGECAPVPVTTTSWGAVKSMYR